MTTFSVTERGTYRTCREQWDRSSMNRQGIEPIYKSPALFVGTLWHVTLAEWEEDPALDPYEIFSHYADLALHATADKYQEQTGNPLDLEDYTKVITLGKAMIANYRDHYKTPIPKGFTLVAAEQTIVVPVPGTARHMIQLVGGVNANEIHLALDREALRETFHAGPPSILAALEPDSFVSTTQIGEQHFLEGTLDGIIANDRGQLYVLEHKTYERKPSASEMAMNDQFLAYLWIMANMPGMDPAVGVLYNGAWKRSEPPKGKTFSDLFYRQFLLRSKAEIADFGRQLTLEIGEMGSPTLPIYMNRGWSTCTFCAYKEVCLAKSRGEDTDWLLERFVPREKTPAWRTPPPTNGVAA